jgi:hypothetical protein
MGVFSLLEKRKRNTTEQGSVGEVATLEYGMGFGPEKVGRRGLHLLAN